jgi:hypothetical protein
MIRNLLIIAGASFVLMLACTAGVAALAGPTILREGWTIPFDDDDAMGRTHIRLDGGRPSPDVSRQLPWTGESLISDLPVDITYAPGPVARIDVTGPKAYVDRLRVENGRLRLEDVGQHDKGLNGESLTIDKHGLRVHSNADRIRIVVTAPYVTHFQVDSSGDIEIENYDQTSMDVAVNGSGDVKAAGKTLNLNLATAGSGDAELEDLSVQNADVAVSGSGNANLTARNVVKIALSGSGDVALLEQPASVTSNISGSGSVRHNY